MKSFVGHENVICLTIEYDENDVIPFLMKFFDQLIPIIEAIIPPSDKHNAQIKEEDNNIFGVGVYIKEPSRAFVTTKFSLFQKLSIPQSMYRSSCLVVDP
jgi:hypothetical protein